MHAVKSLKSVNSWLVLSRIVREPFLCATVLSSSLNTNVWKTQGRLVDLVRTLADTAGEYGGSESGPQCTSGSAQRKGYSEGQATD